VGTVNANDIIIHPNYSVIWQRIGPFGGFPRAHEHDIALARISSLRYFPIPVCLPTITNIPKEKLKLTKIMQLIGFGVQDSENISKDTNLGRKQLINVEEEPCDLEHRQNFLCLTGSRENSQACSGDSGAGIYDAQNIHSILSTSGSCKTEPTDVTSKIT
jgi:hypothetical protein